MTHTKKARELHFKYTKRYSKASDAELHKYMQKWMDQQNAESEHLPGLNRECNVTKLAEIIKECGKCTSYNGNCSISHLLRNMAATEYMLQLLETNNPKKADEMLEFLEKNYGNYLLVKEFTKRICSRSWHRQLGV